MFMQSPWDAIPKATPVEIAKLHDPDALRADLDAIVALHERTCPRPYLRVSKESTRELAERLKASIDRPMTRREFLPLVMELQAGYRSDHLGLRIPREELEAAEAHGERLLPFRAEPRGDDLVVVAVAESERAIEPGDRIVRIGNVPAAEHLARLRSLEPEETARTRDVFVRELFPRLSWVAGVSLPTDVELIRPDGSRQTVTVAGVGDGGRKTGRAAAAGAIPGTATSPNGEVLVASPPFRCLLLPGDPPGAAPIARIDFPTMDGTLGGQWDRFLDQAIAAANALGVAGIIVDIRETFPHHRPPVPHGVARGLAQEPGIGRTVSHADEADVALVVVRAAALRSRLRRTQARRGLALRKPGHEPCSSRTELRRPHMPPDRREDLFECDDARGRRTHLRPHAHDRPVHGRRAERARRHRPIPAAELAGRGALQPKDVRAR